MWNVTLDGFPKGDIKISHLATSQYTATIPLSLRKHKLHTNCTNWHAYFWRGQWHRFQAIMSLCWDCENHSWTHIQYLIVRNVCTCYTFLNSGSQSRDVNVRSVPDVTGQAHKASDVFQCLLCGYSSQRPRQKKPRMSTVKAGVKHIVRMPHLWASTSPW